MKQLRVPHVPHSSLLMNLLQKLRIKQFMQLCLKVPVVIYVCRRTTKLIMLVPCSLQGEMKCLAAMQSCLSHLQTMPTLLPLTSHKFARNLPQHETPLKMPTHRQHHHPKLHPHCLQLHLLPHQRCAHPILGCFPTPRHGRHLLLPVHCLRLRSERRLPRRHRCRLLRRARPRTCPTTPHNPRAPPRIPLGTRQP